MKKIILALLLLASISSFADQSILFETLVPVQENIDQANNYINTITTGYADNPTAICENLEQASEHLSLAYEIIENPSALLSLFSESEKPKFMKLLLARTLIYRSRSGLKAVIKKVCVGGSSIDTDYLTHLNDEIELAYQHIDSIFTLF